MNVIVQVVGTQIQVKIVKNKHAPPFKTVQLELEFGKGISRDSEIIELGCKHKFIVKAGTSFYSLNGQNFHGKEAIKHYFAENEAAREELQVKLREKMMQNESQRIKDQENYMMNRNSGEVVSTNDEEMITEVEA